MKRLLTVLVLAGSLGFLACGSRIVLSAQPVAAGEIAECTDVTGKGLISGRTYKIKIKGNGTYLVDCGWNIRVPTAGEQVRILKRMDGIELLSLQFTDTEEILFSKFCVDDTIEIDTSTKY